jgi:hypothetical protein
VKYTTWTALVFEALTGIVSDPYGGVGLPAVGAALGFDGLSYDDFVKGEGLPHALMSAMYDLDRLGLVHFENVGYGNVLTPVGRDVADAGIASIWPEFARVHVSAREASLLTGLYEASAVEEEGWADLLLVDADEAAPMDGLDGGDDYAARIARMTLLGDLERKGLLAAGPAYGGSPSFERPTYLATVLLSESLERVPAHLVGSSDPFRPAPGSEPKPASPRVKGRPTGTRYISDRESVFDAYRRAKLRPDRNPSKTPSLEIVARELDVSARTLSDYLKIEGIRWPPE